MKKDWTGKKFGRLMVVSEQPPRTYSRMFECVCDCGEKSIASANNLSSGHTKSCGCWQRESRAISNFKHGMGGNVVYRAWSHMVDRCYNVKCQKYPSHGGRGILVCEFLRVSPVNLLSSIGERPSTKHSLDR